MYLFFVLFLILAVPQDLWNLSSLTRDRTLVLCSGRVLTTGPPGKTTLVYLALIGLLSSCFGWRYVCIWN